MEASPEVICWSNSMQWLLSHITLPNKPTFNERSLHHISKVYHLDASPSTNYILNDVQVLCWTQGCSWSATASELSGARWIGSHTNCFLNYRDTHGRKRGWWWKYKLDQADFANLATIFPRIWNVWCYLAGEDSLIPLIPTWRIPLLGFWNPSLWTKNHIC